MQMPKPFDASGVAPSTAQEVIPIGFYPATITSSEVKETTKKTGTLLSLEFTIIDGEHKGRKLYSNINLTNPNAEAVAIGQGELSAICHATGVMVVDDSAKLHNIPLEIKVGMRKPDPAYPEPANEIKGYRKLGGSTSVAAPVTAAPPPITAAATVIAAPAVIAAPTPTPAPAPAVIAPAPVVVAQPVKTMTAKAAGATYEAFVANGWTDETMLAQGYMTLETPASAPTSAPVGETLPPWAK